MADPPQQGGNHKYKDRAGCDEQDKQSGFVVVAGFQGDDAQKAEQESPQKRGKNVLDGFSFF